MARADVWVFGILFLVIGVGLGVALLPPDWSLATRVGAGVALGLCAEISLFANRLMVNSAHVTQFGERAVDTFYVTDLLGGKVTGKERLRQIEQALLAAAGEPAEPVAA